METLFPAKTFTAYDGLGIRYHVQPPLAGPRRGKVVLLNGRAEFMEKYIETIIELNRRGMCVYTLDWRGQGLSGRMLPDRRKGFVQSYRDYLRDLKQFVEELVKPGEGLPVILMGHSMGGHIALRFCREHEGLVDKLILTSPLIDIAGSRVLMKYAAKFAGIAVRLGFAGCYAAGRRLGDHAGDQSFLHNGLTHDAGRFRRTQEMLKRHPDLAVGGVTFGWLEATFDSIGEMRSDGYAEGIAVPVQFVTAGADRVVSVQAQREICQRMPGARALEIPGAWHEVLMETDAVRNVFWRTFDQFVQSHIAS